MRNGSLFVSVVGPERFAQAVWDPYFYRLNRTGQRVNDYLRAGRLRSGSYTAHACPFAPVEYGDIPPGGYLSFSLRRPGGHGAGRWPTVGEQALLCGTMRAYLGNILVTPRAEWLGVAEIAFPVKSEFIELTPLDGYIYFWWAYLRSHAFLKNVPLGSGGTRPR